MGDLIEMSSIWVKCLTAFHETLQTNFYSPFVLLAHFTKFWKQVLHIVQPDTLLRWHRELFRFYWWRKSHGQPKISLETIALIRKMAGENYLWGAERIRDRPRNL